MSNFKKSLRRMWRKLIWDKRGYNATPGMAAGMAALGVVGVAGYGSHVENVNAAVETNSGKAASQVSCKTGQTVGADCVQAGQVNASLTGGNVTGT